MYLSQKLPATAVRGEISREYSWKKLARLLGTIQRSGKPADNQRARVKASEGQSCIVSILLIVTQNKTKNQKVGLVILCWSRQFLGEKEVVCPL